MTPVVSWVHLLLICLFYISIHAVASKHVLLLRTGKVTHSAPVDNQAPLTSLSAVQGGEQRVKDSAYKLLMLRIKRAKTHSLYLCNYLM